jgi:hypothetical protein
VVCYADNELIVWRNTAQSRSYESKLFLLATLAVFAFILLLSLSFTFMNHLIPPSQPHFLIPPHLNSNFLTQLSLSHRETDPEA